MSPTEDIQEMRASWLGSRRDPAGARRRAVAMASGLQSLASRWPVNACLKRCIKKGSGSKAKLPPGFGVYYLTPQVSLKSPADRGVPSFSFGFFRHGKRNQVRYSMMQAVILFTTLVKIRSCGDCRDLCTDRGIEISPSWILRCHGNCFMGLLPVRRYT